LIVGGTLATTSGGTFAWALRMDSDGSIDECPLGVSSNSTVTAARSGATNISVIPVGTNAVGSPATVSVLTTSTSIWWMTQCIGTVERGHGPKNDAG